MILKWQNVAGIDFAAAYKDLVFRIHRDKIFTKSFKELPIHIAILQIRKKQNVEFKDIGYRFLLKQRSWELVRIEDFVDEKLWTSVEDTIERAEEILLTLGYIEEEIEE